MIKKILTILTLILLITVSISPTNAIYEMTTSFESGKITTDAVNTEPEDPLFESVVRVKKNLILTSGLISTDIYAYNGPLQVNTQTGSITGTVTANRNVSITGAQAITGPILRQTITFRPKEFDYSVVPKNLPNLGEFSSSHERVIDTSAQYNNMNLSATLTIDTTKRDVIIVVSHLNMSADINVIGKNRAILIVKSNLNINGHRSINHTTKHLNFDLVVQAWTLNIQNNISFYGSFYFEGSTLYIRNKVNLYGYLFAPAANVELSDSTLHGGINCNTLTMSHNAMIETY